MKDYNVRMNKEHAQIVTEELRKARKGPDHRQRYFARRKEEREARQKEKKERSSEQEKEAHSTRHTSVGLVEQAERPPQLDQIINKMIANNKTFAREEAKLKLKPKIDRAAALRQCRQHMERFDWVVCHKHANKNTAKTCENQSA